MFFLDSHVIIGRVVKQNFEKMTRRKTAIQRMRRRQPSKNRTRCPTVKRTELVSRATWATRTHTIPNL